MLGKWNILAFNQRWKNTVKRSRKKKGLSCKSLATHGCARVGVSRHVCFSQENIRRGIHRRVQLWISLRLCTVRSPRRLGCLQVLEEIWNIDFPIPEDLLNEVYNLEVEREEKCDSRDDVSTTAPVDPSTSAQRKVIAKEDCYLYSGFEFRATFGWFSNCPFDYSLEWCKAQVWML